MTKREVITFFNKVLIISFFNFCIVNISYASDEVVGDLKTFTFSPVPQFEQRKLFSIWQPILKKLEDKTGYKFEFIGSKDIDLFGKKLNSGAYDISYANPFQAILSNDKQGYIPLIRSGKKKLQGIIVADKKNKNIKVSDLSGKVIAFPDPNALAASMLIRAELKRNHNIEFKPIYVKTHSSVYLHVAKGFSYAGGGVNRTLNQQSDNIKDRLEIIYKSQKVPSHPILVHPRVSNKDSERIQESLLEIAKENPELFNAASIEEPVKATIDDYKVLNSLNLHEFYVQ